MIKKILQQKAKLNYYFYIFRKQKQKDAAMEVKAHMTRESMRELAVDKDKPPPTNIPIFGPVTASKPYGSWKPVVKE